MYSMSFSNERTSWFLIIPDQKLDMIFSFAILEFHHIHTTLFQVKCTKKLNGFNVLLLKCKKKKVKNLQMQFVFAFSWNCQSIVHLIWVIVFRWPNNKCYVMSLISVVSDVSMSVMSSDVREQMLSIYHSGEQLTISNVLSQFTINIYLCLFMFGI